MDTKYFQQALREWQNRNGDSRNWMELTQEERSEIMRDAQAIKERENAALPTDSPFVERVLEIARRAS